VRLAVSIAPHRRGGFAVNAEVRRVNLTGTANTVPVQVTIGDEGGAASAQARVEKVRSPRDSEHHERD
jgi:hypothetical protein